MPIKPRDFLRRLFSGKKPRKDVKVDAHEIGESDTTTGYVENLLAGNWLDIKIHDKPGRMAYDADEETMFVKYPDDAVYLYRNITVQEATAFLYADHRGGWVWDNLRIRGTVDGARKPYARVSDEGEIRIRKNVAGPTETLDFPGFSPIQ